MPEPTPSEPRRFTLAELAERLDARLVGSAGEGEALEGVRALGDAGPKDLSFLHKGAYRDAAEASSAAALIVPEALVGEDRPLGTDGADLGRPLLVARSSQLALARAIELFHPEPRPAAGVHETAVVEAGCELHPSASVGPYAVLGEGCRLGPRVIIDAHAVLGPGCTVGADSRVRPGAVLYAGTVLGERVQIHSGAVLGADGFGYATVDGVHHKVPQVGRVVVADDVEVGANSAVDRALLEETRIGRGTKIDNLVQVGHNVQTGQGCILCGQSGVAGSTVLGDYVVLGGQAGLVDHLTLGTGVQIAAKAAVFSDIEGASAGARPMGGIPAIDLAEYRRQAATARRLPEMARRLKRLEKRLAELEDGIPATPAESDDSSRDR